MIATTDLLSGSELTKSDRAVLVATCTRGVVEEDTVDALLTLTAAVDTVVVVVIGRDEGGGGWED